MGIIRCIGKAAGCVAGFAVGLPVAVAGEVVNSDLLREIGEGVYKVSERTGDLVGNVVEGGAEAVYGTITSDKTMQGKGVEKVFDSGATYISNAAKGVANVTEKGFHTIGAILDGDTDEAIRTGKELIKVAAVGALTVGVLDVVDGLDTLDVDGDSLVADAGDLTDTDGLIENPNTHYVTPHERLLPSGETIWVDGDGNTSIDREYGWIQSNPDYKA